MNKVCKKILLPSCLVDGHPEVRDEYIKLLENQPDIAVIAEIDDGISTCTQYAAVNPNVVVLDLNMPGIGGWKQSVTKKEPR